MFKQRAKQKSLALVFLILILSISLRVIDIENRPMHSDEGGNFSLVSQIFNKGFYSYSHENFHGPLYFYFSAFFIKFNSFIENVFTQIEGINFGVFNMRFSSVFFGVLLALLPFFFFSFGSFSFYASSLLALSPSLVFFSRYAIHEMLFSFLTVLFCFSFYRFLEEKRYSLLYLSSFAFACLIATKETFLVNGFILFLSFLLLYGTHIKVVFDKKYFLISLFVFFLSLIFIFSGFLQDYSSLREIVLGVFQWVERGGVDVGHHKPFFYYLGMIFNFEKVFYSTEAIALISLPLLFFVKRKDKFLFLLLCWVLGSFLIYSFIKYKTPWLIINITIPLILYFAKVCSELKKIGIYIFILALVSFSYSTYLFSFKFPYGYRNPYSYVHTRKATLDFVEDLEEFLDKNPKSKVLIATQHQWPLPYYLRDYQIAYIQDGDFLDYQFKYDVILVNAKQNYSLAGWKIKYYRLSDVQIGRGYFKELK